MIKRLYKSFLVIATFFACYCLICSSNVYAQKFHFEPAIQVSPLCTFKFSYDTRFKLDAKPEAGVSAGLIFSFLKSGNFNLDAGFEYLNLNACVEETDNTLSQAGLYAVNVSVYKFQYVQIPVGVHFKFTDKKFQPVIGGYVAYASPNAAKHEMYFANGVDSKEFDMFKENHYEKAIGGTFCFYLGCSYKIKNRVTIEAEPFLLYNITKLEYYEYGYYSNLYKFSSVGLRLFIRYKIRK